MTTIAVCSIKGAPGVTTLALALTAALASDPAVSAGMVEADPAGGDVAARLGLALDPSLVSLAAASRHPHVQPDPASHSQMLPAGGWLVAGATDPTQQCAALATLAGRLPGALASAVRHSVIDCGRWAANSPALPILAGVDRTLVVSPGDLAGIEQLRARAALLWEHTGGRIGVVIAGPSPYPPRDVEAATGLLVEGVMPRDPRSRDSLSWPLPSRTKRRGDLHRMTLALARQLAAPFPAIAVPNGVWNATPAAPVKEA